MRYCSSRDHSILLGSRWWCSALLLSSSRSEDVSWHGPVLWEREKEREVRVEAKRAEWQGGAVSST